MFGLCAPLLTVSAEGLPGFSLFRFNDDTAAYRAYAESGDWIHQIKHIPLDTGDEAYLSIGGAIRQRYDRFENPEFGGTPYDRSDAWLHRYTLHLDAHWNPRMRTFVELYGGFEEGREGGPSPVDENGLELQNVFADLILRDDEASLLLRLGRQEMQFGSGRLVSVREGPTVRRTYNAGLLRHESDTWRLDFFYAVPVRPEPGNFNDDTDEDLQLWGLYATVTELPVPGSLDLYVLGFTDDVASHAGTTGKEERQSLGLRYFGSSNGWDWNIEAVYQFGDFADQDISAWTLASQYGYTFEDAPWSPRLGLSTNIASGDDDPADKDLGSFNAIFPRGSYFSDAAILGPRNFYNFHPSITVQPTDQLTLTLDTNFFWRLETEDGVYGPPGNLLRAAGGSRERFVSQSYSANLAYQISRELSLELIYTHFSTGEFLEETGPSDDVDFVELTLTFKF